MNSSRRVVRVRVAAALAGLTLALAGCVLTSPPDVLRVTDPGDGRSGQIGGDDVNSGVKLRNFLVVSRGNNAPGTLVGAISNQTGKTVKVTLTIEQARQDGQQAPPVGTTTVDVTAGEYVQFGDPAGGTGGTATPTAGSSASSPDDIGSEPASGRVTGYRIGNVPQPAGALLRLVARTADGGGTTIELPILPPVGEYAYLAPSPSASAPSPTSTPSTSATSSPSGSKSPSVDPSGAATQSATGSPSS